MEREPTRLSTEELKAMVAAGDAQVVDVRPVGAYNGWRMRDEARGGHIAGARLKLEDMGESSIASVERTIRKNALAILGSSEEGELPAEGRPLS